MINYIFSNRAVEDISDIWNYTFDVWSELQAEKYYNLLIESCQELGVGKVSGKHYSEIDNEIFGFRVGQHIIFYRTLKKGKVEIVRILHSSMDLKSRISE